MTKRETKQQPKEQKSTLCGDCANGDEIREHWNMKNNGSGFICVRCAFSNRARLKTETACKEHYRPKATG